MLVLSAASLYFLTLIFIFLSLIYFLSSRYSDDPHNNPCPQSYPIVGNLIGFLRNRHRFHDWVTELLSTSPSLTIQVNGFLGLSHGICTADPANLDHLLRSNFSNYVKGTRFQSVLRDLLGNGIFNVDGEIWFTQRKISSHEFNTRSLKYFISDTVQSQLSTRLIPYLSSACKDQEVIDLQDILRKFTFDNICNVAFGVDPKWMDLKNDDQNSFSLSFIQAFDYAVEVSSNRFMIPQEQCQDLLSRFMFSSSNLGFHDDDEKRRFLRDIVISFVLAGKDSTSTALTWFFWLISGHSRCKRLIYNELSLATSPDELPGIFSYDKLKQLNYLHAALSESLRLFPPVPINSRLTMANDTLSSGTYVGKGWFADYSAYAMGRMERLWGPDCREFRPERWLDDKGVFQPCDQFRFPVFHCGPRMCLGKDMAYVQMKSIAASIMSKFDVLAIDGGGSPERISNPPYTLSLFLKMKGGFPVRLKRR